MERLSPIFYGIEDYVNEFLSQAQVADSQHMIKIVKQYVEENKISDLSCRRTLWQVLHEFDLYTKSESNWNQQMRKKKE
jgi:patatin-like phospholipase/acyl hydrolase